jgi:peptide/nickel transport system permease protein
MKGEKNSVIIYTVIILLIVLMSIFPEEITGFSPFAVDMSGATAPGDHHFFGTDFLGRDILSRSLIAARISILIGVVARLGSVIMGLILGLIIGLSGKGIRFFGNGVVEIFLSIPSLLLAMGLAVVMGEGYRTIVIAIIIGTWAPVARFISTRVVEIKSMDFVLSARSIGAGYLRITLFYIIPALVPSLLPLITTGIATSIMMESTLNFLGLGGSASIDASPSWGLMIQEGAKFIFDAPWIIIPPSLLLMILILSFNQIGDKIISNRGN